MNKHILKTAVAALAMAGASVMAQAADVTLTMAHYPEPEGAAAREIPGAVGQEDRGTVERQDQDRDLSVHDHGRQAA
jgi:TRAP-type C4-dicarboxylate transport system substrate-binding protein